MNLEDFKEKCKISTNKDRIEKFNNLIEEQKSYIHECYSPKKKFNYFVLKHEYICPNCNCHLDKEVVNNHNDSFWKGVIHKDTILSCPMCRYEYAMSISNW